MLQISEVIETFKLTYFQIFLSQLNKLSLTHLLILTAFIFQVVDFVCFIKERAPCLVWLMIQLDFFVIFHHERASEMEQS